MEVFYTRLRGSDEEADEQYWANLRALLLSEDEQNVEIGLSVLAGAPQGCVQVADALVLRLLLEEDIPMTAQRRSRIGVFLTTYVPKGVRRSIEEDLSLFVPVNVQTQAWARVAAALHRYEQARERYEPLILLNKKFVRRFFDVAKLAADYGQHRAALPFLSLLMEHLPDLLAAFLLWANTHILYLFPKGECVENAARVAWALDRAEALKPKLRYYCVYKRALMVDVLREEDWAERARVLYELALEEKWVEDVRVDIQEHLLWACVELGDYARAGELLPLLTPSLGIDKLAVPLAMVAWKLHNNCDAAITLLKKTLAKSPHDAQLLRCLSQLYAEIGDASASAFYAERAKAVSTE